ncbi:MAG: hypothetical protein HOL48_01370, partial [Porticoccaceae bacterium]|nr:hypothetical protein [Porticoccaceae bacterium]
IGGGQYFAVEENYSPGLGFTQRTNAELYSGSIAYRWLFEDSIFEFVQLQMTGRRWQDLDTGDLDSEQFTLRPVDLHFRRGDTIHFDINQEKEVVTVGRNPTGDLGFDIAAGTYTDNSYQLRYSSPTYLDVSGEIETSVGDFFSGTFKNINPSVDWQANRHISMSLGYDLTKYELGGESVYTREVEFDLTVAFTSKISLTTNIEYDNVRRQASFNNRLRWNIEPGQDLWVVFNQGLVDQDEDYNFAVEDTSAAFKLRYTFRF